MKIAILVPTAETIFPDTMKCIWDLHKNIEDWKDGEKPYELEFDFVRGHSVDRGRNLCIHRAKQLGATHILFIDNDTTFQPHFLNYLVEHDEPVVLGYYDHRNWNPNDNKQRTNLCKLGQKDYLEQITPDEIKAAYEEGFDLIEVKGGGLGFALIDLKIFDGFLYPYFVFHEYGDGDVLSEDLYFSEQCKRVGIPIYADTRCYCGHIIRKRSGGYDTAHID